MSDEFSLFDLFREEVRGQAAVLGEGLLALEAGGGDARKIEPLMRAAHSVKGAARIVDVEAAVRLAHVMEDALVAAQNGKIRIAPADVDALLRGADVLGSLADESEQSVGSWGDRRGTELDELIATFAAMAKGETKGEPVASATKSTPRVAPPPPPAAKVEPVQAARPAVHFPFDPVAPGDDEPLFDLFREELRSAGLALHQGAVKLEAGDPSARLDDLAQAAKSLRGAARLVSLDAVGALAASIEDGLGRAARDGVALDKADFDALAVALAALVPLLDETPEGAAGWAAAHAADLAAVASRMDALRARRPAPAAEALIVPPSAVVPADEPSPPVVQVIESTPDAAKPAEPPEAVVRVTAASLNRLMGLAGESLVQARWLQPFATSLLKLKKQQDHLAGLLDALAQATSGGRLDRVENLLAETREQAAACRSVLAERMSEFEDHAASAEDLNSRLYREVIVSRMRPFSDGAHGFPRLVRDMARKLDKQVRLEIDGQHTEVDRDVLEKLEAPLTHLLRNSVDHGIESPADRRAAGKPEQGTVRLEVRHRAGMLAITVSDDGRGVNLDRLRQKIVERKLTAPELVASMSEAELVEFLFLPGFSTAKGVTEYSGRGVGLDVVQDTIRRVGGSVRISSKFGRGTTFHLSMPITLSVLRAVLADVAGEPYAFPHNRIDRLVMLPRASIRSLEHRQYVNVDGHNVGLVVAAQLMDLPASPPPEGDVPVMLLSDETGHYGLIVEGFRGEQDLVVRPLDARLGKVPNVSAAAILDDGSPVLIADVEDLIRSMDHFIQAGSLRRCDDARAKERARKRVLVVDDSITVREVERQLLRNGGYDVAVAVDGMDGWNQVRAGDFDLVVSDVDMPRMTGLELVRAIRHDERLKDLPVIIVSYKDRDEDRMRGLEFGANHYLTKSSFHDDTFLQAVAGLIGEA